MKYSFKQKKDFRLFIQRNHEKLTLNEITAQLGVSEYVVDNIRRELGIIKTKVPGSARRRAKVVHMNPDHFNVHAVKNWLTGNE